MSKLTKGITLIKTMIIQLPNIKSMFFRLYRGNYNKIKTDHNSESIFEPP